MAHWPCLVVSPGVLKEYFAHFQLALYHNNVGNMCKCTMVNSLHLASNLISLLINSKKPWDDAKCTGLLLQLQILPHFCTPATTTDTKSMKLDQEGGLPLSSSLSNTNQTQIKQ